MSKEIFAAYLGPETNFSGNLQFKGTVRINGYYSGDITSDGELILGEDAQVEGTIVVRKLGVSGMLKGDVTVKQQTVLYKTARVFGTLKTALLTVEEGAIFEGDLTMQQGDRRENTTLQSQKSNTLPPNMEIPKQ